MEGGGGARLAGVRCIIVRGVGDAAPYGGVRGAASGGVRSPRPTEGYRGCFVGRHDHMSPFGGSVCCRWTSRGVRCRWRGDGVSVLVGSAVHYRAGRRGRRPLRRERRWSVSWGGLYVVRCALYGRKETPGASLLQYIQAPITGCRPRRRGGSWRRRTPWCPCRSRWLGWS